jgi:hypothetical protein
MIREYAFTDADLIASFNESQCARRQYEVLFSNDFSNSYSMSVWADNKVEAKKLAREYAARILQRKFQAILIGA